MNLSLGWLAVTHHYYRHTGFHNCCFSVFCFVWSKWAVARTWQLVCLHGVLFQQYFREEFDFYVHTVSFEALSWTLSPYLASLLLCVSKNLHLIVEINNGWEVGTASFLWWAGYHGPSTAAFPQSCSLWENQILFFHKYTERKTPVISIILPRMAAGLSFDYIILKILC